MIPGPDQVIECPHCGELALKPSLLSGNTFGAHYWTDGQMEAPMLPQSPQVTRCPKCTKFYWVSEAQVVGKMDLYHMLLKDKPVIPPEWKPEWRKAPRIRELETDEYLECLEGTSAWEYEKVITLRVLAWRKANDPFRRAEQREKTAVLKHTPAHQENMRHLMGMLREDEPGLRLMKAELARELGLFEEAVRLLERDFPDDELTPYVELIRNLAMQRDALVAELP